MRGSALMIVCVVAGTPALAQAGVDEVDVLVYTRTTGFRHDSIPAGIAAVQAMGAKNGWVVVATEEPTTFEATMLAEFDVIVFLSTTGDVLDDAQQMALQGWVQAGGGFVGIHSATDTEAAWPWYVGLVGTSFADHPAQQDATIHVVDATHPATMVVPDPWMRFDEWYNFTTSPTGTVDVLMQLDETTYTGGTMGADHPIAWSHAYDGWRSFYTALGHTIESWSEPAFLAHVEGAIVWAATTEPVGGESSSDGGPSDTGAMDTSGAGESSPGGDDSTGVPMPGSSDEAATDPSATAADDTSTSGANEDSDDAGCSCNASARGSGLVLFALSIPRRRRRAARRATRSA
jgi:type 1 glutamine amidotransferase